MIRKKVLNEVFLKSILYTLSLLAIFIFNIITSHNALAAGGGASAGGTGLGGQGDSGSRFTSRSGAVWSYHIFSDEELAMIERGEPIPIYGMEDASALGQPTTWHAPSMTHSDYIVGCQPGTDGYYRYAWVTSSPVEFYSVYNGQLLPAPNPNKFQTNWQVGAGPIGSNSDWHRSSNIESGSATYRVDLVGTTLNDGGPNGEAIGVEWQQAADAWGEIWDNPEIERVLLEKGFTRDEFKRRDSRLSWFCEWDKENKCPEGSTWNQAKNKCCKNDGSDCKDDQVNSCPAGTTWTAKYNRCCKNDGSDHICSDNPNGRKNYGSTKGQVGILNASSRKSSQTKFDNQNEEVYVFAKPGDSMQFEHSLDFSVQGVAGNSEHKPPRNLQTTKKLDNKPETRFRITSNDKNAYLFGDNHIFTKNLNKESSENIILEKGSSNPIELFSSEEHGDYSFKAKSPSRNLINTQSPNNAYSCLMYNTLNPFINSSFQVPGSNLTYNCLAAKKTNKSSLVGSSFSQSLTFNNLKGWVNKKSRIQGSCGRRDNRSNHDNYMDINDYDSAVSADNNTSYPKWGHVYNECEGYWITEDCNCKGSGPNHSCDTCSRLVYRNHPNNGHIHLTASFSGGNEEVTKTARVYVPYNFTTDTDASIEVGGPIVYGGSSITINGTNVIKPKDNQIISSAPYATITPKHSKAQLVDFIISPHSSVNNIISNPSTKSHYENQFFKAGVNVYTNDVCSYLYGKSHGIGMWGCQIVDSSEGSFNSAGDLKGSRGQLGNFRRTIPDLPVGTKYCVAAGIYPADSHNFGSVDDNTNKDIAMRGGDTWNISSVTCRTIAKKPNFQVWGGSLYTPNSIRTSITKKIVGLDSASSYDDDSDIENSSRIFGSWSEYGLLANGEIKGMSSGAGLGYGNHNNAFNLTLPGGHSYTNKFRELSNLSVSNTDPSKLGRSGISAPPSSILGRLEGRYRNLYMSKKLNITNPHNDINHLTTLENGIEYVKVSGNHTLNGPILKTDQFTNGKTNTRVYYVDGDLTINGNICYSDDQDPNKHYNCNNHSLSSYNLTTNNIDNLPQILIFAKNIKIASHVSRIDAWLIADKEINTCHEFKKNHTDSNHCHTTLHINGPVFAEALKLYRTAGSDPGQSKTDGIDVLYRQLNQDGSITPAEVFNLRPDTYYWAYSQSQRSSEAITSYMREVAPRW